MSSYLLPAGLDLDALAERLELRPERPHKDVWTVYDTFDGRLHAAGLTLRHAGGALTLGDGTAEPTARAPQRLFAADLGALRERLEPEIEMRALTALAKVEVKRTRLAVLNGDDKTVARLVAEESAAGARLTVSGVRGYDADLARVNSALGELYAPTTVTLADAAIAAAGGTPGGVSSKLDVALEPGQRADAAATVVLRRLIDVYRANLPGTLADVDTEFLHDLRVSVRRTRSLQRQFKRVFEPGELARFRAEFKGLQEITSDTRDLDVYLLDFDGFQGSLPVELQPDLDPLRAVIERRRKRAFTTMARRLRASTTLDEWDAFVGALVTAPEDDRPWATMPVEQAAAARISSVYRTMIKDGSQIDDDSPHEALHDLRKIGKELRYLLEFFASLFDPAVVKPLVKSLKALQDVLGRFQDREVQAQELRDLRDDVATAEGGAAALMAMGLLVDRLAREQHEARTHFGEQFAAFKENRAIVKATFG